jgi:hypothetical protein
MLRWLLPHHTWGGGGCWADVIILNAIAGWRIVLVLCIQVTSYHMQGICWKDAV